MTWDIENLRKIAGLSEPLTLQESWDEGDDDSDEDEDVKTAEKEAKKRNIKMPKVDVDVEQDLHNLARTRAAAKAAKESKKEEKPAAKKEEKPAAKTAHEKHEASETAAEEKAEHGGKTPSAAEEKKETAAEEKKEEAKKEEAKRRGKAPNADSKRQRLHAYLKANPGVKRGIAMKWAQENLDMGEAYASQQIQAVKAQIVKECFMLYHPSVSSFVLHENKAMGMYQWISEKDLNTDQEPMIFATEAEAIKTANYLLDFNNQLVDIRYINLED